MKGIEMSIEILHPAYEMTVGINYFADHNTETDTYDTPVGVDSIKSVGVTKQKADLEIWASGMLFEYSTQKTGTQLVVDALQIPSNMVNKYLGKEVEGGFSYDSVDDRPPEFAYGNVTEYSNGKKVFTWYPRCRLIEHNPTSQTRVGGTLNEPAKSYTILALPRANGLIEVEYDQNNVTTDDVLTEETFFSSVIKDKETKPTNPTTP